MYYSHKKKYADATYKDKNILELNIVLWANHYTNYSSMHVCLPIKIKAKTNNNNDVLEDTIVVNIFFRSLVKRSRHKKIWGRYTNFTRRK